jgi:hypothetical protein
VWAAVVLEHEQFEPPAKKCALVNALCETIRGEGVNRRCSRLCRFEEDDENEDEACRSI